MRGLDPRIHGRGMLETMPYYVYIMASQRNGTLYVGATNDLVRRAYEHREHLVDGFTKSHDVNALVYFETYDDPATAIQREKNMKHWKRDWKIELIERENPDWNDLFEGLCG